MYETGPPMRWENGSPTIQEDVSFASSMENLSSTHRYVPNDWSLECYTKADISNTSTKRASDLSDPSNTISEGESSNYDFRNVHELAGGLEDWKDIQSQDVDRYGFITQRRASTRAGTPEPQLPTRTSTVSHGNSLLRYIAESRSRFFKLLRILREESVDSVEPFHLQHRPAHQSIPRDH